MDGIYHNTEFEPEARAPTSPHCTITARRKDSKQLHRFISYRYHSLEQRRSSERSRRTAASTKRDHRVRNGNTPNRAGISAPSPSGRSPASTHATSQKQPSANSDRANRSTYHSAGGVGSGPAAPRAKRRLRWRDRSRSRRPPPARRREGGRRWRRSCRRARAQGGIAAAAAAGVVGGEGREIATRVLDLDSDLLCVSCLSVFLSSTGGREATRGGEDRVDGGGKGKGAGHQCEVGKGVGIFFYF